MKRLILTLCLFAFCAFSCTDDKISNSLNGSWKVISFDDLTSGTSEFKTPENSWDKDITIKIDNQNNPYTISGLNTTNQFSGEFTHVGENQLSVSYFVSTKVNQPSWADEFDVVMTDDILTYSVTDETLVIYYDDHSKSVTLKRN